MPKLQVLRFALLATTLAVALAARADVTMYTPVAGYNDGLDGFNAAGGAGVALDFDSIGDNTLVDGLSYNGATFHDVSGNSPLTVVRASETFAPDDDPANPIWKLPATSGAMVLSPGGKDLGFDPSVQTDSMEIDFDQPTRSLGFDLLCESYDVGLGIGVALYDADGNALYSVDLPSASTGGGDDPAGSQFFGFISDGAGIARVVITDSDNDSTYHDANIGLDTLRFTAAPVPEPSALAALGFGALTTLRRRRK